MGSAAVAEKLSDEQQQNQGVDQDEKTYPSLKIVLPAMAAIYMAFFIVALDRTIIGTAIPSISKDFNSFGDIAWYEAGFLLPLCVLQLSLGRVFIYYSAKWMLTVMVAIFGIGSIVCATAPTSSALIIGRVITGIGGAGIGPGAMLMITNLVPLQSRPKYMGSLGAVFGVASIVGPILGGFLTAASWRWCFWINLPISVISVALILFLAPKSPPPEAPAKTWLGKMNQLDPIGFLLVGPATICLLLAMSWGGKQYAWKDGRIIALFAVAGILSLMFVASQVWRKDQATIPPKVIFQRSILAGSFVQIGVGSVLVIFAFYLPIWFQVVQGKSPQGSGLALLPLLLSNVLAVIASGILTSVVGYYAPLMIIGGAILIVGAALVTTWQATIGPEIWIGYQIIVGTGLGLVLQGPNIAAQTVLPNNELSIGLSVLTFMSFLSGTVFVTLSQTLLEVKLVKSLRAIIPNLDGKTLAGAGATSLRDMVDAEQLPVVLKIYNDSLKSVWCLCLGLSVLILVASFGMEWKSVKGQKKTNSVPSE